MDNRKIGVFDSGVGGLTVFSEIIKQLPNEDITYIGDTKRFPFGNKSKESIISISKQIVNYLILQDVKLIVIACGTATSQALEELRKIYKIPIIGIIEPTIENCIKEDTKSVGIIATKGTIRSGEWEKQIKQKNNNIETISIETPLLASMAEEGWTQNKVAKAAIKEYMKEFKNTQIEKIILGCTHYPLFEKLIKEELGEKIETINTGVQMAKYLEKYLKENQLENKKEHKGKYQINLTDTECNFINVAEKLLGQKITINKIEL